MALFISVERILLNNNSPKLNSSLFIIKNNNAYTIMIKLRTIEILVPYNTGHSNLNISDVIKLGKSKYIKLPDACKVLRSAWQNPEKNILLAKEGIAL